MGALELPGPVRPPPAQARCVDVPLRPPGARPTFLPPARASTARPVLVSGDQPCPTPGPGSPAHRKGSRLHEWAWGVGREKRKGCRRSMDTPRSTQAKSPCDELILGKCMLTCPCLIYVMTSYSKAHIYLTGLVFSRGTACLFTRLEVCVALTFSRS